VGEPAWKQRAGKVSDVICKRATTTAKRGKVFKLKDREVKLLSGLGVDAGRLMDRCFNEQVGKRRIVSARKPKPYKVPF
jgi:hypothetical protein